MKEKVLTVIRLLNEKAPAEMDDIKKGVGTDDETLISVLNELYEEGKISAQPKKNKRVNGPKYLDFIHIKAYPF